MSDDHDNDAMELPKKPCTKEILAVGAASVILRHQMFDLEPFFADLKANIKTLIPTLDGLGIARMEIAEGELLVHEAQAAVLKLMFAHDKWRAVCERHGIATPTNGEILEYHKSAKLPPMGPSAYTASKKGNLR